MKLSDLLGCLPDAIVHGGSDPEITAVVDDSRQAGAGALFVAIPGFTVDGHAYVAAALAAGAAAVVVERGRLGVASLADAAVVIEVADPRVAVSALAAAWHGWPGQALQVVGITGTDGKTTTSFMTCAVLDHAGLTTGLIGTVDFKIGGHWEANSSRQTTPEALEVQALLARMRDGGVSHAVVESTSHGLALHKLDDCAYDVAVVTNVTEDHLDFHGTRAAYLAAKGRLIELTGASPAKGGPRFVVLNRDDSSHDAYRPLARVPVLTYALDQTADLRGASLAAEARGSQIRLAGRFGAAECFLPIPGPFNVANALAAACVALGHDVPIATVAEGLAGFGGVPGRFQRIEAGQPFPVIIDYAHTGPSFRKLLGVLRPLTRGRLIAVFGSAGERAPERRAGMGFVAAELADLSILTSEDPRREDPDAIIADIAEALRAAGRVEGRDFRRCPDRTEAIRLAIEMAGADDLVVLAGKGHEQSIIVGDRKLPWDERAAALAALGGRTEKMSQGC